MKATSVEEESLTMKRCSVRAKAGAGHSGER